MQGMRKTRVNIILFLSLLGLLVGVTAISFHHHDNVFLQPTCSLCKVKTAFSGTINKIKAEFPSVVVALYLSLAALFSASSGFVRERETDFIHAQVLDTYPNKAPPFRF